jgi:hypothetical protein
MDFNDRSNVISEIERLTKVIRGLGDSSMTTHYIHLHIQTLTRLLEDDLRPKINIEEAK